MSHALTKGKDKLKKNRTHLTEQTIEGPSQMKKNLFQKVKGRGGHWKSRPKKQKSTTNEEDLSQPWLCEETDPFTSRIRNFEFPKRIHMPGNVKTYDRLGDPEDHLKFFQTAAKVERLLFDELLPESIDNYVELRKAFLANFLQQKKYIKDPVEIHHIKQREGKSTEAFMERFKAESIHVKDAPECMRVSGFMHGITNPDLIKRLNDNIPKSVDEMMSVTTAFLRGEIAMVNQSRKKGPPSWRHHEATHKPSFDKNIDFKNRTPIDVGPAESRNKNKLCEFYGDKCHNTNECIHLKKQIEEAVKFGQLSHLIKELKQGSNKGKHAKAAKKEKPPGRKKPH
ncbi:reverse transcriptase domain-containing protein [Tanacetum coccineum]